MAASLPLAIPGASTVDMNILPLDSARADCPLDGYAILAWAGCSCCRQHRPQRTMALPPGQIPAEPGGEHRCGRAQQVAWHAPKPWNRVPRILQRGAGDQRSHEE